MSNADQPAFRAYTVVEREGSEDYWLAIGAAWPTKGDGLNLILQALPINGKIVLRRPKPDDAAEGNHPRVVAGTDQGSRSKRR